MTLKEQIELLRRGTSEIISEKELAQKLSKSKPLRIKLGVDPTVAHVTLGWAVVLRKLRDFQRLGHTACLIIGDFTAQIGDPSGKSKTRPQLTREEVQKNVQEVSKQVYKILDPAKTEIYYNQDWLGKMSFDDVIRLASRTTVARILERDDFTKRLNEGRPIALHEILYPLCQGYDSVEIKADVELGGNDQKFNNLVGRTLMEQYGLEPQVVILCPLLIGTDGKEKMSQSLGNYISVVDSPNEMFGKTMSIPDELMENWFELCTDVHQEEYKKSLQACANGEMNPRDLKRRLAREIVALYHGIEAAEQADSYFRSVFSLRMGAHIVYLEASVPSNLIGEGCVYIAALITQLGFAKSNSEAKRLIQAGAVSLDNQKITEPTIRMAANALSGKVLRVGKHHLRKIL